LEIVTRDDKCQFVDLILIDAEICRQKKMFDCCTKIHRQIYHGNHGIKKGSWKKAKGMMPDCLSAGCLSSGLCLVTHFDKLHDRQRGRERLVVDLKAQIDT
jgi:hypothetical protein